ncbi:CPCC family cysteine-rich protein [Amycolatopsis sp. NPDC050768]|uniref:CPCC family cysteine-rich protein n=1 Tax=Amycolatopsis sp. NPDC050768 TaxID=3154839 RepID=UPI0033C6959A
MTVDQIERFPCPCCGQQVHEGLHGSSMICPICRSGDDLVQLRWPMLRSGANNVSLIEAQSNYRRMGASEHRRRGRVLPASARELPDDGWRPIYLRIDNFEDEDSQVTPWPDDRRVLYWWRPMFLATIFVIAQTTLIAS